MVSTSQTGDRKGCVARLARSIRKADVSADQRGSSVGV